VPQAGHFLHNELPALLAVYEHFFAGGEPTLDMIFAEDPARMNFSEVAPSTP
jgi:hypothetical protein